MVVWFARNDYFSKLTHIFPSNIIPRSISIANHRPPINPPEEIEDPNDKKPEDWDDRESIVDVTAKKPDDWDDTAPPTIPDESAVKPEGWLDNEPEVIPDTSAEEPKDW